jgi:hypothetical protein
MTGAGKNVNFSNHYKRSDRRSKTRSIGRWRSSGSRPYRPQRPSTAAAFRTLGTPYAPAMCLGRFSANQTRVMPTHALVVIKFPARASVTDVPGEIDDLRNFEQRLKAHSQPGCPIQKLNAGTYMLPLGNGLRPLLALVAAADEQKGCTVHTLFFDKEPEFLPKLPTAAS